MLSVSVISATQDGGGTYGNGTILQQADYLPYGEKCYNPSLISGNNAYLYGGKQLQTFIGIPWYDSQARYQNTEGLLSGIDPLCEQHYSLSPYAYAACNPVNCVDPWGLTTYWVNGNAINIDDGYDESISLSSLEYRYLMFLRRFHGDWYDAARLKAMDHHGYITASGDIVLAASSISSSSNDSVLDELAALALIDVGVIDPSDVYIYKAAAEGAIIAASVIANRFFYIEKAKKEFAHLRQRSSGPEGKQYALIATADGWYENVRGGVVFLNKGDVWKYGETTREDRYSAKELDDKCLYQKTEFVGTQQQAKRQEKVKIYRYFFRHGTLPPGNRIFR